MQAHDIPRRRSDEAPRSRASRGRALLVAVAAVAVAALAFLWIPHWILVGLPFGDRSLRVGMATTWVGAAFVAAAWFTWKSSGPGPG